MPWTKPATPPRPEESPAAAAPGAPPAATSRAPETPPAEPGARPIFAARQPIFDRASEVAGYEILFRDSPENRFTATDPDAASAATIERGTTAFGLEALAGERTVYVNLTRQALLGEFYRMLPPERSVIELLESVEPDRAVLDACRRARDAGYRLALDDFTDAPRERPLLEFASVVKVDFRAAPSACDPALLDPLRARGVTLLAEKVETREEHHAALDAGYDLFQGFYYCRPRMIETRDLPPSRLAALRFLAEVSRPDASFERLEAVFRDDVGLTVRLLRYLNSAAFGWRHEVTSLRHALSLMGLEPLRRWAVMIGLLKLGEEHPSELCVTALSRARFAEELGPEVGLGPRRLELFLTGMLSVVDTLVGRPLHEVLAQLAVPGSVRAALLEGRNALGSVLRLVRAYERGDWAAVEEARAGRPVEDRLLASAYVQSVRWADATARW